MEPYYPFSEPYRETLQMEERAWRLRMHDYEHQLRLKQAFPLHPRIDFPSHHMLNAAKEEEAAHFALMDTLHRQRALLDRPLYTGYYDDEALIHSYATGLRASEYQQQLIDKLKTQRNISNIHPPTSDSKHNYHTPQIQQLQPSYFNHRHQPKQLPQHSYHIPNDINKQGERQNNTYQQGLSQDKYSNENLKGKKINNAPLQYSKGIMNQQGFTPMKKEFQQKVDWTSKTISNRKGMNKFTNEAVSRRIDGSPFQKIYASGLSKNKVKRMSQSLNMTNLLDGSTLVRATLGASQNNGALKRIENRLRLSMVIFKDSKLRNNKHQAAHLFNRYENEVRVRREIRDKINCNPIILRKHAMVVN